MQTHFFLPLAFATSAQEPRQAADTPTGGPQTMPGGQVGGPAGSGSAAPPPACGTEMWIMMPAMLLIMYFLVLRPEQKRRKEQQALLASIKQGDHVVTAGGMHGVVAKLTEKTVTLRVDTLHMTFDRVAIARVERGDGAAPPTKA